MSRSKYTKERLAPIVANARSVAEVLRALGLKPTGGNYRSINGRMRVLGLDTSHFTGQNWNRGLTSETSDVIRRAAFLASVPDEEVFVERCPIVITGTRLANRLRRLGRPYECAVCAIREWRGAPLTLHLDHVNGVHTDNRLENLRFLCPNCHQQTHTWGNPRRRRQGDVGAGEVREAVVAYRVGRGLSSWPVDRKGLRTS